MASGRRARPARVDSAPDDLDGNGPVQRERGSHHGGRDPGLRDERGHGADRVRDAGRLDVGLHGGLVAVLRRLRRDEPQRDRPRVRDVRQRDRRDGRAVAGARPLQVRRQERHGDRVVPLAAGAEEALPLVAARQHELHGDGRPRGAPVRGEERPRPAAELLAARPERRGEGPHRGALRGRPARGAGRQGAARGARQPPARARNRGGARDGAVHREGGHVPRRHVRREDGAAVPGLRAGPSPAAEVSGEGRVEAVRRRELGAAREPGRRGEGDRGSGRPGGRGGSRGARRRVPGPRLRLGPRLPAQGHGTGRPARGPRPSREVQGGGRRGRVHRRTG